MRILKRYTVASELQQTISSITQYVHYVNIMLILFQVHISYKSSQGVRCVKDQETIIF